MKKKYLIIIVLILIIVLLGVCLFYTKNVEKDIESNNIINSIDESKESKIEEEIENTENKVLNKDIPDGNFSEIGDGTLEIRTIGGPSENGNIPVIFFDKKELADGIYATNADIVISTRDFDGSKLSYIYVDGVLQSKEQLADVDMSIYVNEKLSTVGVHKVEVIQFDDNGNVITYKTAGYEIKEK